MKGKGKEEELSIVQEPIAIEDEIFTNDVDNKIMPKVVHIHLLSFILHWKKEALHGDLS